MSPWVWLGIGVGIFWIAMAILFWAMCVVASDADDLTEKIMERYKEEQQKGQQ